VQTAGGRDADAKGEDLADAGGLGDVADDASGEVRSARTASTASGAIRAICSAMLRSAWVV